MSEINTTKATMLLFWRHMTRYPFLLTGMLLTTPIAMLVTRFLPTLVAASILDRLSRGDFTPGDWWGSFGSQLILAIALSMLGGILIWRIAIYFNWKLEGFVQRDLNQHVYNHLMKLSAGFHASSFGGALVSANSKITGAYVRFVDTTLYQVIMLFSSLLFSSILLWNRARSFVILLNLFTLGFMACAVLLTRRVRKLNALQAEASNSQTAYLADSVTNVMAIKSFATQATEEKAFAAATEKTRNAEMAIMRATLVRDSIFGTITNAIYAISLFAAVIGVVMHQANVATVFLVINYTGVMLDMLWQFSTQALRNYNHAFGDSESMIKTLAIQPEVKDAAKPEPSRITKGAIEFKNMDFTHPESGKDDSLFANLNLHIKPSEKIGLVGHSGSGKTTLTKLLLRFSDIDGGEILIDGQNIAKIKQDDLRRSIAYVPQEPLLFHRSIRENIAYGKPGATEAEVRAAAEKANALEFIKSLPDGFETMVGERGVKLSGGQRQRVAIARALIKDAPILVLDEATSALDSESEKLIQSALWELMKGRTAIVIAHRLSTIQRMDRIVVLDHGDIIEQGSHTELLAKKGTYAKLWAHQSGGFIES